MTRTDKIHELVLPNASARDDDYARKNRREIKGSHCWSNFFAFLLPISSASSRIFIEKMKVRASFLYLFIYFSDRFILFERVARYIRRGAALQRVLNLEQTGDTVID